ncbi:MAG TPA: hypothetical protein VE968_03940, partial [Sphingomicrobium sp.]|nr:hypothetical protein [Sphingomicrobium sp.]
MAHPNLTHRLHGCRKEDVYVAAGARDANLDLAVSHQQPPITLLDEIVKLELDDRLVPGELLR